jgi:hypothetical protein
MPSEPAPAERPSFVGSDDDVGEVIELYDGDPREAVRVLLFACTALEEALRRAEENTSYGYVRGHRESLR